MATRFEQLMRLMDSPIEGEAVAAYRAATKELKRVGFNWGKIYELVQKEKKGNRAKKRSA